ncbi:MAG: SCO family protein [Methylacidiphilales bacterium]|nr:SCO family protein [Candidatus Methylacidiphilales bacterium]
MPDPSVPSPSPYRWPIRILAVLILGVVAYHFATQGSVSHASKLRRINDVPPFVLTERSGRTITNQDLRGKIWVADFIFTTCPGPCPLITANMAKVQDAVAHDPHVQLVTFTVDPQDDTPAVLAAYANKFGADPNRWWFLTGPEKSLDDLIENGFYQVVQDNRGHPLEPGQFIVTHSTSLVLVDADGVVRGSYDGIGTDGRTDLLNGIKTLEKEENP